MSECLQISKEAFLLLERLMSAAQRCISTGSLKLNYNHLRSELVNDHWLTHCDTETEVIFTNDDERPYEDLEWDSEQKKYKYFNPYDGWVFVDPEELKIYEVNKAQYLKLLQQNLDISDRTTALEIQENSLWYLGVTRIKSKRLHVYYSRKIKSRKDRLSFLRAIALESGRVPAIILMPGKQVPEDIDLPLDMAVAPMSLVGRSGHEFRIDRDQILPMLKQYSNTMDIGGGVGLRFSSDYRIVYWNGGEYRCTKKQAAVVEKLYEEGGRAHKDVLRAAADTNAKLHHIMRDRIDGKFYPHPLWGTLIKGAGGGIYYFDNGGC